MWPQLTASAYVIAKGDRTRSSLVWEDGLRIHFVASVFLLFVAIVGAHAQTSGNFAQQKTVPLPNVEGRIDHMAIDLLNNRLFVSALGNNSIEVIDLHSSSVVHSIKGLQEPQGVYYAAALNKLYVSNAGNGECDVYDGTSFRLLRQIDLGGDADNIHPDPLSPRILVSAGNGISVVDTAHDMKAAAISLPGHPEGFVLEQNGPRVFVNVPLPSRSVFVVDWAKGTVVASWSVGGPLANVFSNFPMALDDARHRLFVGTRLPAALKIVDTPSGKLIASLAIDRDPDDIFYDTRRQRVYVSCGEGFLDVFQQVDPDHYKQIARIPTAAGARTSLWVPEMDRLFVAVPHRDSQQAEIRVLVAE
jgi:DNA-binding beta-propeller fold protein YncE